VDAFEAQRRPLTEAQVIAAAQRYAKKAGIVSIRMVFRAGPSAGWPDFLYLIPGGRPLFIEYKAPGGKPTPLQSHKIETLKDLGYDVELCDSADKAIQALTARMGSAPVSGKGRHVSPQ
jgi:hypothetical protein